MRRGPERAACTSDRRPEPTFESSALKPRRSSSLRWPLLRAWLLAGCGCVVWTVGGAVRVAAAAADDRPVALPPFLVEEATKGPPWRYGEAMGYEVLSRCNEATTRRVVETHYQLHQLLAEILPASLQVRLSVPKTLILYDEELQPAASREVIERMLRRNPGPAEDNPVASPVGRGLRAPVATPRYSFLPNLRLWDRDGMAVFMIVRRDDFDTDRLSLTHDYISYLVKARMPTLAPWFIQGFLSLYREIEYERDRLTLKPLEWISPARTATIRADAKAVPPVVLPLAAFFGGVLPAREPEAIDDPVKLWQSQASLFVRWGLDPAGSGQREAFLRFVARSAVEGSNEVLLRECLGLDFSDLQAKLLAYLPAAVRKPVSFRPARKAKLPAFPLSIASDGQIARLKGDWERLEIPYVRSISPELAPKYVEQARRTLKRGYDRGERDPRLLAVLGLCEIDAGNDAGAREFLESAAAIGPIRPRANYELARLRLAEFRAAPGAPDGRLSVGQAADVLKPLFAARAAAPPLPEVYELIAEVWRYVASTPTRAHLAVLDEGVRLFPRQTTLVLQTAELFLTNGYREEAAVLAEVGVRIAGDEATRARVTALQRQLAVGP
jgi:hypothetical protein